MKNTDIKKVFSRRFNISKLKKLEDTLKSLSLTEKTILGFFAVILALSTAIMLYKINDNFMIEIPEKGGSLTEGIIGTPRFINPLLAISNADRDLSSLIYSGLMKATPEGELVMDLAKEINVSEDGLTYDVTLKDDIYFHDNTEITTEDIKFTIEKTQDSIIKSPKKANWNGVEIEKISDKEIRFILKTPYSPFLENTTLGILPKHIWESVASEQFAFSQLNIEPIGSGPYKIEKVKTNSSGILESYTLESFNKYALGEPYISKITINLYPNEEKLVKAFEGGIVEGIGIISTEKAEELNNKGKRIERTTLPRIFGLFLNQNKNSIFTNMEIRKALNKSLDKQKIIDEILNGYGVPINGPGPPSSSYFDATTAENSLDIEGAIEILEKNGWKLNENRVREKTIKKVVTPFSFSISTSDAPELKAVAEILKEQWKKIGAEVTIKIFEVGDLNQNVIRPRDYESLLFGEIIGRDMDLFAFWHSSQRNDPGLNIALYANINSDKLLEEVRSTSVEEDRLKKYIKFQEEITDDVPAIFIYSPDFTYVLPTKIKNFSMKQITMPSERFLDVHNWNIETNKIWKIFQ